MDKHMQLNWQSICTIFEHDQFWAKFALYIFVLAYLYFCTMTFISRRPHSEPDLRFSGV